MIATPVIWQLLQIIKNAYGKQTWALFSNGTLILTQLILMYLVLHFHDKSHRVAI